MAKVAVKSGSHTRLIDKPEQFELYPKNYKFRVDAFGAPFLADFDDFVLPSKLYGEDVGEFTSKVLNSFEKTEGNLGVLLSGLKGTGKSVLVKNIAIEAKIPTIIIDAAHPGALLLSFLDQCPQSCVVIFDEFEKVYRQKESQESLLPLLDGLSTTKHIFLFTVNGEVSPYLEGRPSRIRYHKRYMGLKKSMISDLLDDILDDPSKKEELEDFIALIPSASMDLVCSLAQERNLYPEESLEAMCKTFNFDNPMEREYSLEFEYPVVWIPRQAEAELGEEEKNKVYSEFYSFRHEKEYDCTYNTRLKAKFEEVRGKYPYLVIENHFARSEDEFTLVGGLRNGHMNIYLRSYMMSKKGSHTCLSRDMDGEYIYIADFNYMPEKGGKLGIYSGENKVGSATVYAPFSHRGAF